MKTPYPPTWNVNSELEFIDNLGSYSMAKASRAKLLVGYLRGLAQRADFTLDERALLRAHVEQLLSGRASI